jgi:hypothetical protein
MEHQEATLQTQINVDRLELAGLSVYKLGLGIRSLHCLFQFPCKSNLECEGPAWMARL